ncbi:MAG: phosphopantetheine-binding protein [Myxococcales bacterium]|jgi:acyl carrier protein
MLRPHLDYERIVEQTIFSRVRALLAEKFGIAVNEVELDSILVGDLGIEQADMDYLMLTLEAAFDIDITTAEAARIVRVRDAVRCVLGVRA